MKQNARKSNNIKYGKCLVDPRKRTAYFYYPEAADEFA